MTQFTLGNRIREFRLRKGITQIDLAKELCTPSMISQIESDRAKPSFKILKIIANRLDVSLEELLSDTDLNLTQLSTFKMAKAMLASKEYFSAIPLFEELLQEQHSLVPEAEIQFALAECYLNTDRLDEAELLFERVSEISLLRQDHSLLTQVYKSMGLLEMKKKRYQLAAFHINKAISELNKLEIEDHRIAAELYHHLGVAHYQSGEITQAIECFNSAITGYENTGAKEIGQVYLQLSVSYQKLLDHKKALEYAEKASTVFDVLDQVNQMAETKRISAVLKGQNGDIAEAVVMLHDAIATFQETGSKEKEGVAHAALANIMFEKGELENAESECRLARSLLPELHLYQAYVNRILGKIARVQGKTNEAKRRFQMAADCFKTFGEALEWDQTMFEMAQLYHDSNDMVNAFAVMKQIRQYNHEVLGKRGIAL